MNIKSLLFLLLPLLIGACSNSVKSVLAPDSIYDDQGLTVITSSFNNKQQTMSTLYGNIIAFKTASTDNSDHAPGEEYRLVTWEQKSHPLWFGSNINGALKSIERISTSRSTDGSTKITYELIKGSAADFRSSDQQNSIKYILDQKPSVFP